TSTIALTNVTMPYVLQIANRGVKEALTVNASLGKGLNTFKGLLTNEPVANAFGYDYKSVTEVL
ncbi:MAG: alanine dehydrogenase, partial [Bacilli bacterium]